MLRCATLALLCAALAHAHEKRAEMSPVPFMMGSRYGRSPERMMSPRMDRFIMGSRYGKRSEAPMPEFPERGARAQGCAGEGCVVCRYTDVLSLFKCVRSHTNLQFSRRSTEDKKPGEVV